GSALAPVQPATRPLHAGDARGQPAGGRLRRLPGGRGAGRAGPAGRGGEAVSPPRAPAATPGPSRRATARTRLVHLRLPFQLLLAPVFLWGLALGGGGVTVPVLLGFVAFHLFLYGGAPAFNSYYDRDSGPVGGLERPPPVVPELLPFSLALQAAGWLLAAT